MKRGPIILMTVLVAMLCMSLAAITLIIFFNYNRPSSEEVANACKTEVGAAIAKEYASVSATCEAETEKAEALAKTKVAPDLNRPGFTYPSSWTAMSQPMNGTGLLVRITPGFLALCEGCDGPNTPVLIMREGKVGTLATGAVSFADYVHGLYDDESYSNVTFEAGKINGSSVIIVKGTQDGLWTGPFEDVLFEGKTSVIAAYYRPGAMADVNPLPAGETTIADGWQMVKNSLDFSKIN